MEVVPPAMIVPDVNLLLHTYNSGSRAHLAIEHQAELHSSDADFARFPGLRWRNPLKR